MKVCSFIFCVIRLYLDSHENTCSHISVSIYMCKQNMYCYVVSHAHGILCSTVGTFVDHRFFCTRCLCALQFVNYYIDCRQLFSARCEISSLGICGELFQVACIIITNEFCRRKGGGGGGVVLVKVF